MTTRIYFTFEEKCNLLNSILELENHRDIYRKKYWRLTRRIKRWYSKLKNRLGKLDSLANYPKCMSDDDAWFLANYQYLCYSTLIELDNAFKDGYVDVPAEEAIKHVR